MLFMDPQHELFWEGIDPPGGGIEALTACPNLFPCAEGDTYAHQAGMHASINHRIRTLRGLINAYVHSKAPQKCAPVGNVRRWLGILRPRVPKPGPADAMVKKNKSEP